MVYTVLEQCIQRQKLIEIQALGRLNQSRKKKLLPVEKVIAGVRVCVLLVTLLNGVIDFEGCWMMQKSVEQSLIVIKLLYNKVVSNKVG